MRRAIAHGTWLLLVGLCWSACREVSVCEGGVDCAAVATAGEGGASGPAPSDGGSPEVVESAGMAGQGNANGGAAGLGAVEAGAAGLGAAEAGGNAAGGAASAGPSCSADRADCDESTLTVCETPITFNFRHCGSCNARCEGICSNGKCKPGQALFDRGARTLVANASAAFALIAAPNDTENLHRFALDNGADSVLAEGLKPDAKLLLGANRVYLHYDEEVLSLGLDGSGATTEAFSPRGFGVTNAGVYYTSYVYNPKTDVDTYILWFRAQGASAFTAISSGPECYILGSSSQSLLLTRATDDTWEILLANGAELTRVGDSPEEPLAAAAAPDAAVFLVANDAVPSGYELLWLTADEPPQHFALEAEPDTYYLVPAPEGVAVHLVDHYSPFVRIFSAGGAQSVPLGIPLSSTVMYVDERHVWYSWYGAPDLSQHFLRARQFEPNDLLP